MNSGPDAERIKEAVDLHALAARYTLLTHWARREEAGPCPRCGGTDRFHVYDDDGRVGAGQWWKCYRCHPRPGDAIEFVRWLERCDFRTALSRLAAQAGLDLPQAHLPAGPPNTRGRRPADAQGAALGAQPALPFPEPPANRQPGHPPASPPGSTPADPGWQERAQREVAAAAHRLWQPEGDLGRRYLTARGLYPLTARTWDLGFVFAWHPRRGERWPAIAIPWREGGKIMAVQYRFIAALPGPADRPATKAPALELGHGERFSQKPGGIRRLYGLSLPGAPDFASGVGRHPPRSALILVEGEFNALSIWQTLHDPGPWAVPAAFRVGPVDVLSFGSESGATAHELARVAAPYREVIVWADRGERAAEGAALLRGGGLPAQAVSSPGGQDANDLLRTGRLVAFLAALLGCAPLTGN